MTQLTRRVMASAILPAVMLTLSLTANAAKEKTDFRSEIINKTQTQNTATSILDQVSAGENVEILGTSCDWHEGRSAAEKLYSDLLALLEIPGIETLSLTSAERTEEETVGSQLADYALQLVGLPYVYGGTSTSGFDCSGFVQYVYRQNGYEINRTATAQLNDGYTVAYEDMKPGDIIYFGYADTATHVGIYVGGGEFVHAENSGTGVVISKLSQPWYAARFLCAHRVADE